MLNITENSISKYINLSDFNSFSLIKKTRVKRLTLMLILGLSLLVFLCLFLPWTQNINANGYVTTRSPEQRPQAIQSVIDGRIEEWYVKEGDYVEKGDTIVFISEIKSEYFDPALIDRTSEQVQAKLESVESYDNKVNALRKQYLALQENLQLKLQQTRNKIEQAKNKIKIDSVELVAQEINFDIAKNQFSRTKELYEKGLKSLTELQEKELKMQETNAKVVAKRNGLLNQRNELTNLNIELIALEKDYGEKLAKSESDQQSALSSKLESMAQTAKLQNQLRNYSERRKLYHITAPQSGYITQTVKKGIGETVKQGKDVLTIMPSEYDLAVEVYLKPQDLPLMNIGNKVQLRFDGWPAIVISGWPESSTGIFFGKIVAIDRFIDDNGLYRVLISPNNERKNWPEELRIGTGTRAFVLLKDVPIWYEIWRQLNGFPPDYYQGEDKEKSDVKLKAPIKSVK